MQPPTGTIIFLFTDIERSTHLYQNYPESIKNLLARHNTLLTQTIQANDGYVFQIVGDAICAAFHTAERGLAAAIEAQHRLQAEPWVKGAVVRVRMGLHAGKADLNQEMDIAGAYTGYGTLARTQRITSAGHGGQILLSSVMKELLRECCPDGVTLRDLGSHRLSGLAFPEQIYQVVCTDLPFEFPPLKTLDRALTNLPVQLTSFIGREKEIAEIRYCLNQSRLLTLTGPGGCGKSRLTIQVASELLDGYPDGIWFSELASISDSDLAVYAVARTLGLREESGGRIQEALVEYLRDKTALLIFDNCEHLIEACARLAEVLLRSAPKIRILASSREALGIAGERTYPVPSLSLQGLTHPTIETLGSSESARLFNERAKGVLLGFQVTEENAPAIAQICRQLDGIPLAIELAAARVSVLQVEQIAARLTDAFHLLTGGSRTALPRQQTLLALIDWSYKLLTQFERTLLQRLSVFAAGWQLEAAEAICGCAPLEPFEVLDLLTGLVNKSLVIADCQPGGETRYRFLGTIRLFAHNKLLESGERSLLRDRHLGYLLELAQEGEPHLNGKGQLEWMQKLETELDNFRLALDWALGSEPEAGTEERRLNGLQLTAALAWFFSLHGNLRVGYVRLEKALELSTGMSTALRAKLLAGAGWLASVLNYDDKAQTYSNDSIALSRRLDDRAAVAFPTATLATLAFRYDDFQRATALGEECLALYTEAGNRWGIRRIIGLLGYTAKAQGDYARAEACYQQSLAICREIEDQDGLGWTLYLFGNLALKKGELGRAMEFYEEALPICQQVKSGPLISWVVAAMAHTALLQGNFDLALKRCQQSLELKREMGNRSAVSLSLIRLGHIALRQKDAIYARKCFEEGLKLAIEIHSADAIAQGLAEFGLLAEWKEQAERSIKLLSAAQAIYPIYLSNVWLAIKKDIDETLSRLHAHLGEPAFEAAWKEGKSLTWQAAHGYALASGKT
jgi:predicted ATPase/class 3 adenylate cyclase